MVKLGVRKEIKKWGNSAVIILTKDDLKVRGLKIGDIVDIADLVKVQLKKKERKKHG